MVSIMVRKPGRHFLIWVLLAVLFIFPGCMRKSPEELTEQYKFDQKGRLVQKIAKDGGKTTVKYNHDGLPVEIIYPGGWVRYGYTPGGLRTWMRDGTGVTEYYYDGVNRLRGVFWKHGIEKLTFYDYDDLGNPSYIALADLARLEKEGPPYKGVLRELRGIRPDKVNNWREKEALYQKVRGKLFSETAEVRNRLLEHQVTYYYDLFHRLAAIDTPQGKIRYQYNPQKNQVQRFLPNGIATTFTYGPDASLKSLRHEGRNQELLAHYQYDFNPAGKVIKAQETTPQGARATGYDWDSRGYLQERQLPDGGKVRYDYDIMGNRILKEETAGVTRYTYDKFGRLVQAGAAKYEWDPNGNLITQIEGSQKSRISYDGRNLPSWAKTGEGRTSYHWDGDGTLVYRQTPKEISYYLPNPLGPPGGNLAEFDKHGRPTATYIYGDALLAKRDAAGETLFYLEDGFNSIRNVANHTGKIVGQGDYSPFGRILKTKGGLGNLSFGKTSGRSLPEIRSSINANRVYNLEAERYVTADVPAQNRLLSAIFNKYAHADSGPKNFMETKSPGSFKQEMLPTVMYWGNFAREFFTGIPETISWQIGALRDYYQPVFTKEFWNDTFKHGFHWEKWWEPGAQPGSLAWQAEKYGNKFYGDMVREIFKVTFEQSIFFLIQGATGALLPKFRWELSPFTHLATKERAAEGALHLGSKIMPGLYPHFYAGEVYFHIRKGVGFSLWYAPLLEGLKGLTGWAAEKTYHESHGSRLARNLPQTKIDPFEKDSYQKRFIPGPNWPDGGGGGGAIRDPFKAVEAKLGGIKLAASGKFLGEIGAIQGAVFDPEKQCLVLLGDQDLAVPPIKLEDLAIALLCVYGSQPHDPSFSLDPDNPRNADGPWLRAVYYPKILLAGTDFGNALFEADWLLKQYSFGIKVDKDGKQSKRASSVPGFKNSAELSFEEVFIQGERQSRARLWIESDNVTLRRTNNSIYFDQAKMRVKAKKQVVDPKSLTGLSDVDTTKDFRAVKFAELFTQLYDEIAKESPEFERVRQLAKAVALAKWIKEQGIKVDMGWLQEYSQKRGGFVARVPRLSNKMRKEESIVRGDFRGVLTRTYTISGGVKLNVEPKFTPDDGTAKALQQIVKIKLNLKTPAPVFTVQYKDRILKGWVLPTTKFGQDLWKNYSGGEIEGTIYNFDKLQNIVKSDDKGGNITTYGYDGQNHLIKVNQTRADGSRVVGEKNEYGSLWTIKNPQGHKIQFNYDHDGLLKEVLIDDQRVANYAVNEKNGELLVQLKHCQKRLLFDKRNNLKEFEIRPSNREASLATAAGRLSFDYNEAGNLTRISGTGLVPVQLTYTPDGKKPVRISKPEGSTSYVYYPDGRLKEITGPEGSSRRFTYAGQELANIQLNYKGIQAEYRFTKDGLVKSRNLLGGEIEYQYDQGRLTGIKQGKYGETDYVYDDQGNLKEIRLPDGSRTEYRYSAKAKKVKEKEDEVILTVVIHPSATAPKGLKQ